MSSVLQPEQICRASGIMSCGSVYGLDSREMAWFSMMSMVSRTGLFDSCSFFVELAVVADAIFLSSNVLLSADRQIIG
jgi:hypothetical protein